jgi:RNA polymerase sigma factor (sigma-70 family)
MIGRGYFRPRLVSPPGGQANGSGASGGADRFRATILPHMDAAYSYARYLARDGSAAEDIAQNAFVRALRGFDGWQGDNAKAWLLAIVRHCHLDAASARRDPLRGAEPVEAIDDWAALVVEPPEATAIRHSDAAMLRRAVEELPEPFREALILREFEELTYKEIAAITHAPIGTVMSRLARARGMLAALILPLDDAARSAAP